MLSTSRVCNTVLMRGVSQSLLPMRHLAGEAGYSQHSGMGFCSLWACTNKGEC